VWTGYAVAACWMFDSSFMLCYLLSAVIRRMTEHSQLHSHPHSRCWQKPYSWFTVPQIAHVWSRPQSKSKRR
jgi:hypothetical protein